MKQHHFWRSYEDGYIQPLHTYTCMAVGEFSGCTTNISMYIQATSYEHATGMFMSRLVSMGLSNPDHITITDEGEV